jgi:hypothetical protein
LRSALRRLAGTDFGLHSPRWVSRYSDAARLATAYRSGRVLLAGDAAHIHYPAGGQGLNTGMQDAVNLGWKLAAVVGRAHDQELLETYASERRPVAERVLANTRAQTALTRVDPQSDALRSVFGSLIQLPEVNRTLAGMVSALDVRYPLGEGAGQRAPDRVLPDGSRLFDHLHDARPILLRPSSSEVVAPPGVVVVGTDGPALLVRPDGHVAWAEAMGAEALNRWC